MFVAQQLQFSGEPGLVQPGGRVGARGLRAVPLGEQGSAGQPCKQYCREKMSAPIHTYILSDSLPEKRFPFFSVTVKGGRTKANSD
jgi:hypothetical protein